MISWIRRNGWQTILWSMTIGCILFYLRQIWETRGGQFQAPRRHQRIHDKPESLPHVTIVVPARDEQRNIRRCVLSLLQQDYPDFEVVVVDDGSTDATASILADLQQGPHGDKLTVIHNDGLPEGWTGKAHAMAIGAEHATGDWILFTDADTLHQPGALSWALEQGYRYDGDLVSLLSYLEMVDFSNHIMMPIVFMGITAQYPPAVVANPRRKLAIANGQFLLIRRTMYEAVGGFGSPDLRHSIVDDRDLAAAVKAHNGSVILLDGRDYLNVCMYRNLREAWRGWSKNAYVGSLGGPFLFALMVLALPIGTILPYILFLIGFISRKRALLIASSLQIASITSYRWLLDGQLRHSRWWGWTHPIGGAIMTGLLWRVSWLQLTGRGVQWSGRTYRSGQTLSLTRRR